MDPSSAQNQEMGSNASSSSLESMLVCPKAAEAERESSRKARLQPEQALNCPRCDSTNTKFCYYNNYSLSQPRYFCKSCRRYWTKGGTLRNVPVGGGCRKNKRSSSSSSRRSHQDRHHQQQQPLNLGTTPSNNPHDNPLSALSSSYDSNFDLSFAFARLHNKQLLLPDQFDHLSIFGNPNTLLHHHPHHHDVLVGNLPIGFEHHHSNNPIGFHTNLYNNNYGLGNGEVVESVGVREEMGMPYNNDHEISNTSNTAVTLATTTTTTMKQEELCNSSSSNVREVDEGELHDPSMAVWGFPWQNIIGSNTTNYANNGDGDDNCMGGGGDPRELSGRESWNGIITPSWHGLLNSPLM